MGESASQPVNNNSKVKVKFKIADIYSNWTPDTIYYFKTMVPQIIVRYNPFTPNGDKINDEAEFDFEDFKIYHTVLKIFDIHGKKIVELTSKTKSKRIKWDDKDENGKRLLPGIYLYVLLDSKKAVTRGCVAIAR